MIRASLLAVVLAGPAWAETLPALYDVTGVVPGDVLNLRAGPQADEPVVGDLARDARGIEVVEISPDGKWGLVAMPEGQAHARLRFLKRQPRADWFSLDVPLTCLGTEPFWALRYHPAGPTAEFVTPEGEAPLTVVEVWPGTPHQTVAGITLGDRRFAALRGAACSDGMSDRPFGIEISLFSHGETGPVILSGCCSLQP